ncbi:MAG: LPS assembly lipoprotein LptE [Bacteroidota bacterium]
MATIKKQLLLNLLVIILALVNFTACNYSFSGASVPSHLKTIAVMVFADRSGSAEFDLGQRLTKRVIQRFVDDNTLLVGDRLNSDSILDGTIVSLSEADLVVVAGEKASKRRITINVRVVYKDLVKKITVFERNFSWYGDYLLGGDITSVRSRAIEDAFDRISQDILLGVVSNW